MMFQHMQFKIAEELRYWKIEVEIAGKYDEDEDIYIEFFKNSAQSSLMKTYGMLHMYYYMACQYAEGPVSELEKLIEYIEKYVPDATEFLNYAKSILKLYLAGVEANKKE